MKKALLLAALPLSTLSLSLSAAEKHVHGEAELYIAISDHKVIVELASPAANIVGFEHQPANEKQEAIIKQAEKALKKYQHIVTLDGGSCKQEAVDIDSPFTGHDDHKEHGHKDHGHDDHGHKEHGHDDHGHKEHAHDDHGHKEHGHDDHGHKDHGHDDHGHKEHAHEEHGHKEHDDHGHKEHDHHDHEGETHSSYRVSYELHCHKAIKQATVTAFGTFPALEKATVNWVTENKQGSVFTSAKKTQVNF